MRALATIRALGPVDARSVVRDSLLRWIPVLTPALALLLRFGAPLLTELLQERADFDLRPYYPLIMSFMGLVGPGMVGTVIGFLLLDQRDDATLPALLVTPLSLRGFLVYRLSVPMIITLAMSLVMFPLAGLIPMRVTQVVLASVTGVPVMALYALVIGTFAANKVQGFAIAKALGIVMIPAIVSYFVAPPWQTLFGVIPIYWSLKVFWLFEAGDAAAAWPCAAAGLAYQGLLIWLLSRRFARIVHR